MTRTRRAARGAVVVVVALVAGLLGLVPSAGVDAGAADLELTVVGTSKVTGGGLLNAIDWTITLRNSTSSGASIVTATGIVVRDSVVTNVVAASTRQGPSVTTGTYDNAGTWRISSLAPGAQAVLTFRTNFALTLNAESGTVSAQVTAQSPADVDSQPAENAFVGDQDDESVFRTGGGTNFSVGDQVWNDLNADGRYTTNEPGVRAVRVIVTNASTSATLYAGQTDDTGKWLYPAVRSGTSITVRFIAPSGAAFTTAKVGDDAGDSDPVATTGVTAARTISANDLRLDAGLRLPADVSLTKSATPVSGAAPLTSTYTVRVTNSGPNAAGGVVVTDSLPGTATVSTSPSVTAGSAAVASGAITWTIGQIAVGATVTMTYSLRHTVVGAAINRAQVTAMATPDPDSVPNAASVECSLQTGQDDCATATVSVDPASGSVTGVVWQDANRDGQRQSAETLLAGVTVRLRSTADAVLATTTTATTTGRYTFSGLTAGTYVVEVVAPSAAVFSPTDVGSDLTDSDVASTGRVTVSVTTAGGAARDAGLARADNPTADTVLVPQGISVTFNVLDNDAVPGRAAGGSLPTGYSWSRPTGTSAGAVTCNTAGSCIYRSLGNYAGLDGFTYVVTNPSFGPTTVTVTIDVLHVNDRPVARNDRGVTAPGERVELDVLANDEDPNAPFVLGDPNRPGDELTIVATGTVTPTAAGQATCTTTECAFTPNAGFTGRAQFTYTVNDSGESDPRVANAGVPGGFAAVEPLSAVGTVTVFVDPARRPSTGFTGYTATTGSASTRTWSPTADLTGAVSCVSARPRVSLSWNTVAKATAYRIERLAPDSPAGSYWVAVASPNSTTFTDDLVGEGTSLRYRVTPLRHRWEGTPSTVLSVTTPATTSVAGC